MAPGQEQQGTAVCVSKWVLGGHYLQQEYTSKLGDQPFTVLQFLGYDAVKKRFFEIKMDNMDTAVLHTEGTLSADGRTITRTGERSDPGSGKAGPIRTVTTLVDADHFTLEWFLPGPDGKEARAVLLSHARRKPATKP